MVDLLVALSSTRSGSVSREAMFIRGVMVGRSFAALTIPCLIAVKVVERLITMLRQRAGIPVVRIKAVVDMTVKTVMTVKQWTRPNKYSTNEPVRSVVAVRCTIIGSIVKVSVRTHWRPSNTDADGDLRRPDSCTACKCNCEN